MVFWRWLDGRLSGSSGGRCEPARGVGERDVRVTLAEATPWPGIHNQRKGSDMIGSKVVVTTKHRGVFFGELLEEADETVVLGDAQNCVYWSVETKGFVGLAHAGPQSGSKVTRAAPRLKLFGVTSVVECTPEAAEAWEGAPWR